MRHFAEVNGERAEPRKGLRGVCGVCHIEMISKCGIYRRHHWAHKSRTNCDPWWEAESDWHREWKDHFPKEWHEIIHVDERTGEKHIADVKNPAGLVIEIQRSPITDDEKASREEFYGHMIWIVDGDRDRKTTNPGFFQLGRARCPYDIEPLVYAVEWRGPGRIFHNWGQASKCVYIDFGGDFIWRLLEFRPQERMAYVSPIAFDQFIDSCLSDRPIGATKMRIETVQELCSDRFGESELSKPVPEGETNCIWKDECWLLQPIA